jgi:hypothetical protein
MGLPTRCAGVIGAAAFVLGLSGTAQAQTPAPRDKGVQMTGCIVRENDYRKAHNLGKSLSLDDQFVIVNADVSPASGVPKPSDVKRVKPSPTPSSASETCAEQGTGQAYRISGHRESELKAFVGHRLEITGTLQHGTAEQAESGAMMTDKLPSEVEMADYREVAAVAPRTAATPTPTPAPAPEVRTPEPRTPAPARMTTASPAPKRRLPKTASDLPLIGLIGVLTLATGAALWRR